MKLVKQRKYDLGDFVKVRTDLEEDKVYNHHNGTGNTFISYMNEFKGLFVKITSVCPRCGQYKLNDKEWDWTDEMIEGKVVNSESQSRECAYDGNGDIIIYDEPKTYAIAKHSSGDGLYLGVATCGRLDTFNKEVGYQIAIRRAYIEKFEAEIKAWGNK